jgi:transcriptional regulator with XRE-family HTH domain
MRGPLVDNLENDADEMRLFQQEWLILEVTELIASLMEEKGIRKKDMAEELGRSKGYVTQLLDGRANMTLRTVSDVMWALGCSLEVDAKAIGFNSKRGARESYDVGRASTSWKRPVIRLQEEAVDQNSIEVDRLRRAM